MDLSKGGGKGSESVPGVSGSPGGSPTRMEMGTASAQVAADTPVPETPPNGRVFAWVANVLVDVLTQFRT